MKKFMTTKNSVVGIQNLVVNHESRPVKSNPENHNFPDLLISNLNPAGNYMFKVNNRNTRTRCEICSKLTIKTPERR